MITLATAAQTPNQTASWRVLLLGMRPYRAAAILEYRPVRPPPQTNFPHWANEPELVDETANS
jgi:hypothetical protein